MTVKFNEQQGRALSPSADSDDQALAARGMRTRLDAHAARLRTAEAHSGRFVAAESAAALLRAILRPGDRVILEGNNQKQARFLARTLAGLDPSDVHDLHLMCSSVVLDEQIALFDKGIARDLDFAFAGPQATALARLVNERRVRIGAIHTYLELYSRYFTDLRPDVALLAGEAADGQGNIYLGANTEETPLLCEAAHAGKGIVAVQVERVMASLPRIDIPADRVEFVVVAGERPYIEPLFTRDPAKITASQVLMGMLAIKGIYAQYGVQSINHGIGYATAAIELLLPTYAAGLGLKNRICSHWILNPHPTLIPAIESGFVRSVCAFGSEPGMDAYMAQRSDVFFTSHDGVLMSNRMISQMAGHYAVDAFVGATLQIDADGNSSTATRGRISGFGGAPNLGANPSGRRHLSPAWRMAGREFYAAAGSAGETDRARGHKLTIQITPTVSEKKGIPVFVERLDGVDLYREGLLDAPAVMLHADDVTHIVTEVGIAFLLRCRNHAERRAAIRAIAGNTPVGRRARADRTAALRARGLVMLPEDLGIDPGKALPCQLAARSMADLVAISGGLYQPPAALL